MAALKYQRPFLITLVLAVVVGVGYFLVWPKIRPQSEPHPLEVKVQELEARLNQEKKKAEQAEYRAKVAERSAAIDRARADSLQKYRKTVYVVKHEKIRNSPDVGADSLIRYFTAYESIYSDTAGGTVAP